MDSDTLTEGRRPGCLRATAAFVVMITVSPVAAVFRTWQRKRRGGKIEILVNRDLEQGWIELAIDSPSSRIVEVRRLITEHVIRLADSVEEKGEYHLVYSEPVTRETVLLPIGPQLHAFGERFHQALAKSTWHRARLLWLSLPERQHLGAVIDEQQNDPVGADAIRRLANNEQIQWMIVSEVAATGVGEVLRFELFGPQEVVSLLDRFSHRLCSALERE